jgi:hypothetical protein
VKRRVMVPACRLGKGDMLRRFAEAELDSGKTICFAYPDGNGGVKYEVRGVTSRAT